MFGSRPYHMRRSSLSPYPYHSDVSWHGLANSPTLLSPPAMVFLDQPWRLGVLAMHRKKIMMAHALTAHGYMSMWKLLAAAAYAWLPVSCLPTFHFPVLRAWNKHRVNIQIPLPPARDLHTRSTPSEGPWGPGNLRCNRAHVRV